MQKKKKKGFIHLMFQLFSYVRKDEIKIPLRRCKPLCNQIIVRVTFNCKNSDSKKKIKF